MLGGWPRPLGIEYTLDVLSGLMAVIVTLFGLVVTIYGRRPVFTSHGKSSGFFYALVLLLLAGLSGMVVTGDVFNLFVFLEISSLAAYALVAGSGRRGAVAAFRYLVLGTLGGSLYLLGVGFLLFETGTLNMAHLASLLPELYGQKSILVGGALILSGLGLKMALFPLHLWLPDAYAYAPPTVAALIASIMTKVGAYTVIRLLFWVFGVTYVVDQVPFTKWILWLALIGSIAASFQAVPQLQFRRLLAYSSISHVSLIAVGIGLATPAGIIAALLHLINHSVMKCCLFLAAGAFQWRHGTERVNELKGLGAAMPWTSAAVVVAGLSLIGIPPTGGFFSKLLLIRAVVQEGAWYALAVILAGSLITIAYVFRVIRHLYLVPAAEQPAAGAAVASGMPAPVSGGSVDNDRIASAEPAPSMLMPIVALAIAVFALGFGNVYLVEHVLAPALPPGF